MNDQLVPIFHLWHSTDVLGESAYGIEGEVERKCGCSIKEDTSTAFINILEIVVDIETTEVETEES